MRIKDMTREWLADECAREILAEKKEGLQLDVELLSRAYYEGYDTGYERGSINGIKMVIDAAKNLLK
jgi:hypothetical protein